VGLIAFADESMRQRRDGSGLYALAAPVIEAAMADDIRDAMSSLSRNRRRFHWREADAGQRRAAVELLSRLDAVHFVVVGSGLDNARQERHRRKCLQRLLWELEQFGVSAVRLDARRREQNVADLAAVAAWRAQHVLSPQLRVDHVRSAAEPLVWMADIMVGAVNLARGNGDEQYFKPLESMVHEVSITLT
jgi:hypothetical protein